MKLILKEIIICYKLSAKHVLFPNKVLKYLLVKSEAVSRIQLE